MPKQGIYKCKHCCYETNKKENTWQHIKLHIKPDKLLACDKCEFVTQYKHHLEYHERKHAGIKPFKCGSCDYRCLNKSMLNSHLKSHSSIYPYQCGDCPYLTKYSHSLKQHLSKYNHMPNAPGSGPPSSGPPSSGPPSSVASSTTQDVLDLRVDSKLMN